MSEVWGWNLAWVRPNRNWRRVMGYGSRRLEPAGAGLRQGLRGRAEGSHLEALRLGENCSQWSRELDETKGEAGKEQMELLS